jgi:hypothetical protein
MQSLYSPVFDLALEMSPDDKRRVGLTTALLIVRRQLWLHRRVELVTWEDQDVIRRSNSIDFTLPRWAPEYLGVDGSTQTTIAVPITLLRKGTLAHFNLGDEASNAVPLLSGTQVGALAEMALLATAELALDGPVPPSIADDIQELTWDRRVAEDEERRRRPSDAFDRLFSPVGPAAQSRSTLGVHPIFRSLAKDFDDNFMAAVLLTIAGGDRRVIHFAYDEEIGKHEYPARTTRELFVGRISRRVVVFASAAGDAASFHMEAEAPEGLRISSRVTLTQPQGDTTQRKLKERVDKSGSYRRVHIHCNDVRASDRLAVILRIGPRSSTIVRGATLTSGLTLLAVIAARLELHDIHKRGAAGAAAVLLVIPTILSLWVARSQEHPATTQLLWPVRIVATAPAVFGLAAAGVLVSAGATFWSEFALTAMAALLAVATWVLGATWYGSIRRQRRRSRLSPNERSA